MNGCLIENIQEELSRLLKKRPALEVERCHVLAEVEKAQFMNFDMKHDIRRFYNHELAKTQAQIGELTERLKELRS